MSQVKERPILFSAPMVRAILEGRKTVTRRVVNQFQSPELMEDGIWFAGAQKHRRYGFGVSGDDAKSCADALAGSQCCPYGNPGDRMWVRETFALLGNEGGCCIDWQDSLVQGDERGAARIYRASCPPGDYGLNQIPPKAEWKPDTEAMEYDGAWRPSIHMPRWASRILLEITDVRVERLQDISGDQAEAEGVNAAMCQQFLETSPSRRHCKEAVIQGFAGLWQSTGGDWDANPWVWCVSFRRVEQ
ncbi:morphogenetic protein [Pseudomonas gingeri]|uniref:Morphogenetic protein n=1 Tax=Pseudomonas gingeri TaxID=117681 RepID=A0A7Y7XBG8_9PSED|nr:morphogenetic protein [Pseudomonas gingeri]NWB96671.1 morphogenetic protein [Pseudomonas gingeri]